MNSLPSSYAYKNSLPERKVFFSECNFSQQTFNSVAYESLYFNNIVDMIENKTNLF